MGEQHKNSTQANTSSNYKQFLPLFPTKCGKRTGYGTNDTVELLDRIPSKIVQLKLDEVLDAVQTLDNLCDYTRCKTKTNLMGQDCEHCNKRFCFKHGLPEVHGCGEAVKQEERKKFLHLKSTKTIKQEKEIAQAKTKLHAKLKDMQMGRIQKTRNGSSARSEKKYGKRN